MPRCEDNLVDTMVTQGFQPVHCKAIREAREGVTKGRQQFGRLCGGVKDTSKKGGMIGHLFMSQLQDADTGKEENMKWVRKNALQAYEKAQKEYDNLMVAWDNWNITVANVILIGKDPAAAETCTSMEEWGIKEAAQEIQKI